MSVSELYRSALSGVAVTLSLLAGACSGETTSTSITEDGAKLAVGTNESLDLALASGVYTGGRSEDIDLPMSRSHMMAALVRVSAGMLDFDKQGSLASFSDGDKFNVGRTYARFRNTFEVLVGNGKLAGVHVTSSEDGSVSVALKPGDQILVGDALNFILKVAVSEILIEKFPVSDPFDIFSTNGWNDSIKTDLPASPYLAAFKSLSEELDKDAATHNDTELVNARKRAFRTTVRNLLVLNAVGIITPTTRSSKLSFLYDDSLNGPQMLGQLKGVLTSGHVAQLLMNGVLPHLLRSNCEGNTPDNLLRQELLAELEKDEVDQRRVLLRLIAGQSERNGLRHAVGALAQLGTLGFAGKPEVTYLKTLAKEVSDGFEARMRELRMDKAAVECSGTLPVTFSITGF